MKRIYFILLLLLSVLQLSAQEDAYFAQLFSQQVQFGSARVQAMGGAFGALGADLSVASTNPAGLGLYRRSEVSLTGAMTFLDSESSYLNQAASSSYKGNKLGNFGYLGTILRDNEGNLKSLNIAVGYNKLRDFNSKYRIGAYNNEDDVVSLTGYYTLGEGLMLNEMAYEAHLINEVAGGGYESAYGDDYGIDQAKYLSRTGYSGEYFLSLAANLNNKVYVGATVGIRTLRMEDEVLISEEDNRNQIADFDAFDYVAYSKTAGTGMNLKLGMIFKPNNTLRVGASIETPTFYNLRYDLNHSINAYFDDATMAGDTISTNYDYEMVTPFRATLSAATVLSGKFIVSVDMDYLDYSTVSYYADDYDYDQVENEEVENDLDKSLNFRLGAEYRWGALSFRAGTAFYGDPYAGNSMLEPSGWSYSGGFGFRTNNFFADFAFVSMTNKSNEYFHHREEFAYKLITDKSNMQPTVNYSTNRAVLTIGLFF